MNELKFNSQICTTKEQSQLLLNLGLNPETADMELIYNIFSNTYEPLPKAFPTANKCEIPAWSLDRLIELYSDTEDTYLLHIKDVSYNLLIYRIEKAIECEFFNKEYLEQ